MSRDPMQEVADMSDEELKKAGFGPGCATCNYTGAFYKGKWKPIPCPSCGTRKHRWNRLEALMLLATTKMGPMNRNEKLGFSGCESPDPLIGYSNPDDASSNIIILDGFDLCIMSADGHDQFFDLREPLKGGWPCSG